MNIEQLAKYPKGKIGGAGSSDFCCCSKLADKVYGKLAGESGIASFAYLYRRFGPPWFGSDPHKDIGQWVLTTPVKNIWLAVYSKTSDLRYCFGYRMPQSMDAAIMKPTSDWFAKWEKWFMKNRYQQMKSEGKSEDEIANEYYFQPAAKEFIKIAGQCPRRNKHRGCDPVLVKQLNDAITFTMKDLLRPVYVRDVPMNICGQCDDADDAAEPSKYAGFGIPKDAMDKLVKRELALK